MKSIIDSMVQWLKRKTGEAGCSGLVLGLSGGVDSSVCACLAKLAFPESSRGLIMPIESLPEDRDDALLLADTIHLDSMELNLTDTFSGFAGTLSVAG
ncbi:MAG: NAD(+) synthetase, partial [Candidatus Wallbacteria bacterium]|nr:NAD(+) synthetase [Candidatus Wallbacteria bacterium]